MVPHGPGASALHTAAILHDVGKLVLANRMSGEYGNALELARETGRPLQETEHEVHGLDHAHAGAYFLGLWGIPYPIVEAVAHHHAPGDAAESGLGPVTGTWAANALVCAG